MYFDEQVFTELERDLGKNGISLFHAADLQEAFDSSGFDFRFFIKVIMKGGRITFCELSNDSKGNEHILDMDMLDYLGSSVSMIFVPPVDNYKEVGIFFPSDEKDEHLKKTTQLSRLKAFL
jgi:hypothetical protein